MCARLSAAAAVALLLMGAAGPVLSEIYWDGPTVPEDGATQRHIVDIGCPAEWVNPHFGEARCYKLFQASEHNIGCEFDAKRMCFEQGASMTLPKTARMQEWLRQYADMYRCFNCAFMFLNANDREQEGHWVDRFNRSLTYNNFRPSYGINGGTAQNDAYMDLPSGWWGDTDGRQNANRHVIICEKSPTAVCADGWKYSEEMNYCYKLFHPTNSWQQAHNYCQSIGANLPPRILSFQQADVWLVKSPNQRVTDRYCNFIVHRNGALEMVLRLCDVGTSYALVKIMCVLPGPQNGPPQPATIPTTATVTTRPVRLRPRCERVCGGSTFQGGMCHCWCPCPDPCARKCDYVTGTYGRVMRCGCAEPGYPLPP